MASLPNPNDTPFPATVGSEFSAPSPYVVAAGLDWTTVDALWGGTQAMRLAGKRFLPQEPVEDDADYIRRRDRTTLHNYYKRTCQTGVAKIFTKDIHVEPIEDNKEVPAPITTFQENVDTQGRNLSQFSKELLEFATHHGISFLLVDYSKGPIEFQNLAEQRASGARPYWLKIPADRLLDARTAKFADGEFLAYFKFMEEETELSPDLLTTRIHKQIRVYIQLPNENGTAGAIYYGVYRKVSAEQDADWGLIKHGRVSPVTRIPVYPVYTNKVGFMLGRPPLMDLAELNIQHWQMTSDYLNILHVVSVPMLHIKGMSEKLDKNGKPVKVEVKVNSAIHGPKDSEVKWVEHQGSSIKTLADGIEKLESRMDALGTVLTTNQNAGVSATANSINTAEANSMLKSFALNLQDALNAAMDSTCQFLGIENTTRLVVNTEYAVDYTTNETMSDVLDAYKEGVIDKKTVIAEGKRRNVFDNAATIVPPTTSPTTEAAPEGGLAA